MALVRLYDFTPFTLIQSQQVDDEFNQFINLLNGTSTTFDVIVSLNSAVVAPIRASQLGAGPIAQWQTTIGTTRAAVQNSGDFSTIGAYEITTGDPSNGAADVSMSRSAAATMKLTGAVTQEAAARTSGNPTFYSRVVTPADTGLTAGTESMGIQLGGDGAGGTVVRQFLTGAISQQREVRVAAPTYAFVGASTITKAASFAIGAAPVAGTNCTITAPFAMLIESGSLGLPQGTASLPAIRDGSDTASSTGFYFRSNGATASIDAVTGSTVRFALNQNGFQIKSDGQFAISSGDPAVASPDVGIARRSAGVLRVTDGSTGKGKVLIGTSSEGPTDYPLDIRSADTSVGMLRMTHTSTSGFNSLDFFSSAGTQVFGVGFGNSALSAPFTSTPYLSVINGFHLLVTTAAVTTSTARWAFQNGGNLCGNNAVQMGWVSSSTDPTGSIDAGFKREAAARVRVVGSSSAVATLLHSILVSANSSSPVGVADTESGILFTNEGATALITFNLPTAVANLAYEFYVQDTDGVRVVANTGDTIRLGSSVSASAGRIDSTTVGSAVILRAINATEWVATSVVGTWVVT